LQQCYFLNLSYVADQNKLQSEEFIYRGKKRRKMKEDNLIWMLLAARGEVKC
jgi:hypothetical protein